MTQETHLCAYRGDVTGPCVARAPHRAARQMTPRVGVKRLLAVLALLAGGLSVEAVQPMQCHLIYNRTSRRED